MPEPGFSWVEALRAPLSTGPLSAATSSLLALAMRPRLFGSRSAALPTDLRSLFQASHSVLCLLDGSGIVRAITPNAARVLGEACDRAPELGVNAGELLQADNPFDVQSLLDDLSRAEPNDIRTWTFKTRAPSGQPRWLEIAGRNLLFDAEIASLFIEIRDVTHDHDANERHHVLGFALESSPDAVMVTNAQGFIEYVNPACERQTGYRLTDLRGRSPAILKSDRQSREFYERMWQTLKQGGVFRGEIANRRKNGELYFEDLL